MWKRARRRRIISPAADEDCLKPLRGTWSLPFPAVKFKRVAVKVIDPRGNEVMRVHKLGR